MNEMQKVKNVKITDILSARILSGILFCSLLLFLSVASFGYGFDRGDCYKNSETRIMIKKNTTREYCVSVSTAEKLVERGWGEVTFGQSAFYQDILAVLTYNKTAIDYEWVGEKVDKREILESYAFKNLHTRPSTTHIDARPLYNNFKITKLDGSENTAALKLDGWRIEPSFIESWNKCIEGMEDNNPNHPPTYVDDCVAKWRNGSATEIKPVKTFDTTIFEIPPVPTGDAFHAKLTYDVTFYKKDLTHNVVYKKDILAVTRDFEDRVGFHTLLDTCHAHESTNPVHDDCVLEFYDGSIYKKVEGTWQPARHLFEAVITSNDTDLNYAVIDRPNVTNSTSLKYPSHSIRTSDCKTGISFDETDGDKYVDDCMAKFHNGTVIEIRPEKTFDTDQFSFPPPPNNGTFHAKLNYDIKGRIVDTGYAATMDFENHVGFHTLLDDCGVPEPKRGWIRDNCVLEFSDGTIYKQRGEKWQPATHLVEASLAYTYNRINLGGTIATHQMNSYFTMHHSFDEKISHCKAGSFYSDYYSGYVYVDDCVLIFNNVTGSTTFLGIVPERTFDVSQFSFPPPPTNGTFHAKLNYDLKYDLRGRVVSTGSSAATMDFENHVGFHTLLNTCVVQDPTLKLVKDNCILTFHDGTTYQKDEQWARVS